jgi:hypothetical protein
MPYLTPHYVPGVITRHILIPVMLAPYFEGSLYFGGMIWAWEKSGNMEPGEVVQLWRTMEESQKDINTSVFDGSITRANDSLEAAGSAVSEAIAILETLPISPEITSILGVLSAALESKTAVAAAINILAGIL